MIPLNFFFQDSRECLPQKKKKKKKKWKSLSVSASTSTIHWLRTRTRTQTQTPTSRYTEFPPLRVSIFRIYSLVSLFHSLSLSVKKSLSLENSWTFGIWTRWARRISRIFGQELIKFENLTYLKVGSLLITMFVFIFGILGIWLWSLLPVPFVSTEFQLNLNSYSVCFVIFCRPS